MSEQPAQKTEKQRGWGVKLKDKVKAFFRQRGWGLKLVERVKTGCQYAIGTGIFVCLTLKVWPFFSTPQSWSLMTTNKPLDIVGQGLALSAGIQLAYMLFTPALDEAVEPVILGIAATILLLVSKMDGLTIQGALAVLLLVLTMAILFVLRKYFVDQVKSQEMPEPEVMRLLTELKAWCDEQDDHQSHIAQLLHVDRRQVSEWCEGRALPSLSVGLQIQTFLKHHKAIG